MPSLKIRRLRMIAIETFKILHKSSPVFFLQDLINIKNHSYNFRYTNTADIPNVRTTRYGFESLRYSAPKIWNSLPSELRDTTNVNQFRTMVNTCTGPSFSCIVCRSQGLSVSYVFSFYSFFLHFQGMSVCYGFSFYAFFCIFSHNQSFLYLYVFLHDFLVLIPNFFYFAYYLLPSLPHKFVCLVF